MKNPEFPLTTDEWVAVNAMGLAAELACHLRVFTEDTSLYDEERAALLRCIMISIRQWDEGK